MAAGLLPAEVVAVSNAGEAGLAPTGVTSKLNVPKPPTVVLLTTSVGEIAVLVMLALVLGAGDTDELEARRLAVGVGELCRGTDGRRSGT